MPVIHIKDLGMENEEGQTIQEMAPVIIAELAKDTAVAVKDSSAELGGKALDSLQETGSDLVDGVKNLFK
jgi:hypothetical protein